MPEAAPVAACFCSDMPPGLGRSLKWPGSSLLLKLSSVSPLSWLVAIELSKWANNAAQRYLQGWNPRDFLSRRQFEKRAAPLPQRCSACVAAKNINNNPQPCCGTMPQKTAYSGRVLSLSAMVFRPFLICCPQCGGCDGFVFVPMILRVLGYLCPGEMSLAAPVVEQNTLLERLASGCHDDSVILAHSARLRLRPVELDGFELKCIQSPEKLG